MRTAAPVGTSHHTASATITISMATASSDCGRKMVAESGISPCGTGATPGPPPVSTIWRMAGCNIPGVAICRAAEPDSPWAQMLPVPNITVAARVR